MDRHTTAPIGAPHDHPPYGGALAAVRTAVTRLVVLALCISFGLASAPTSLAAGEKLDSPESRAGVDASATTRPIASQPSTTPPSTSPAKAVNPIVIRFSHVVAADTPKGLAAEHFREVAERLTQGRVRVEVYPNSQLYRDGDELEALQRGLVQMLAPSLAKFDQLGITAFEVFDLPYLFSDESALRRVTDGPLGREMFGLLENKGIHGLAYWDNGFKSFSANRRIHMPADLKGLRMRIQGSGVIADQMRVLDAKPIELAFSNTAPALRSGLVDGTENPPSNFWTQNMCAYQSSMVVTRHAYLGYAVIVNKLFWDGLPGDVRQALELAMREATRYENMKARDKNAEDLNRIRDHCATEVVGLNDQELAQWREKLRPVHDRMAARIGSGLVRRVHQAAGYY